MLVAEQVPVRAAVGMKLAAHHIGNLGDKIVRRAPVAQRCQRHKIHTVHDVIELRFRDFQREPGLARAARPQDRDQAQCVIGKQLGKLVQFIVAPDKRRGFDREVVPVHPGDRRRWRVKTRLTAPDRQR